MKSYFETSAIVKLLIEEPGSIEADDLWAGANLVVTSRIAYAEARAALAAAARARRMTPEQLELAKHDLEDRFSGIELVEVTERVVRLAGDVAERHALRGYDAVHVASARLLGRGVTVATWDRAIARSAAIEGLAVAGVRP